MEFLSYDNGVIKHPAYRDAVDSRESVRATQKRRKRQLLDNTTLALPSYTQNLLAVQDAPFVCTPEKICFNNYDVGKEYAITVALLNRTTVPKTFRVMPLIPRYANVLRVAYEVPPRISPGLSWEVTLYFRPQENTDFSTALYIRAEEGYFAVPIVTSQKSFVLSVQPKSIDFGTVVVGEEQTRHVVLRNKGALSGTVIVGGSFKALLEQKHTNPVTGKKASFLRISPQQYKVDVAPFSIVEIALNFSPLNTAELDTDISFTDKNDPSAAYVLPVVGVSTQLPVFLTNSKIDFGACFFDEEYWDEVRIVNRTNLTANAVFQVPPSLSNCLTFTPHRLAVQPGEQYKVQILFTPTNKLPSAFLTTIECTVGGQTLPLPLTISATLSERVPRVLTTSFDVGHVLLNTLKKIEVPVTNDASVVQLVGFENLPAWIEAAPEVMEIVPHETAIFSLTLEAPQKGRFSQRLRIMNEFGDAQTITITGQGVNAPFGMAARMLFLPPCNLNGSVSATTVLYNTSEKAGEFRFFVPNKCFKISPNAGVLQPGETISVAVIFSAPPEFETVETLQQPLVAPRSAKSKKDGTSAATLNDATVVEKRAMYDDWEPGHEPEKWSRHRSFSLKCVIDGGDEHSFFFSVRCCALRPSCDFAEAARPSSNTNEEVPPVQALSNGQKGVRKVATPLAEMDEQERPAQERFAIDLDYGNVPIHCVVVRTCRVRNADAEQRIVRAPPPSPFSPFLVLTHAFGGIPPHGEAELCVAFQPQSYGRFSETIKLDLEAKAGDTTSVYICVRGTCSPTQLTITPASSASSAEAAVAEPLSRLAFHCTQKNDSSRVGVNFANVGPSPLSVVISDGDVEPASARTGRLKAAFLFHPRLFTLQPGTKQHVDVVFAPSDEGVYSQRLRIAASGETRELTLNGRCVKDVVYALVPHALSNSSGAVALAFSDDVGCRPEHPISLTFSVDEVKTVVIGSAVNGPSGEFEVLNWEQTHPLASHPEWSITPPSHAFGSGAESRLNIRHLALPTEDVTMPSTVAGDSALFPLRFTVVLKGEAANAYQHRVLYFVCSST